jgi:hypothetical protein
MLKIIIFYLFQSGILSSQTLSSVGWLDGKELKNLLEVIKFQNPSVEQVYIKLNLTLPNLTNTDLT